MERKVNYWLSNGLRTYKVIQDVIPDSGGIMFIDFDYDYWEAIKEMNPEATCTAIWTVRAVKWHEGIYNVKVTIPEPEPTATVVITEEGEELKYGGDVIVPAKIIKM